MTKLTDMCSYFADLKYDDLPKEVIDYTKLLIADHYISAIAGYIYNCKFSEPLVNILMSESSEGKSTVLFHKERLPAGTAGFINAVYCHGADIDDGHRTSEAHPGVAVIAAVLALSEEIGASGEETLNAVVVGYETFIRVANSILPSHLTRGFHTTGTVGNIAAAAACAKLMELDGGGIEKAISLASTQASGLLIVCESGQASKPINPGRAAQTGIMCAKLAKANVDAPIDVFESKKGFTHAFSDTYNPDALTLGLGKKYNILDTYIKLYPSCRHTQATIEAIKKYIAIYGPIKDAKRIEIHTYPIAVDIVGHNLEPKTIGDVKFSIPYTAACTIMNGNYTLENLANFETERDEIIAFSKKIEVIAEEEYDDILNGIRGSKLVVVDSAGVERSAAVDIARGEGDDRIDQLTLRDKAISSTNQSDKKIDELIEYCNNIDNLAMFVQPIIKLD